jgi:hypothetical protein
MNWQPSFNPKNERTRWLLCLILGVYVNVFIYLLEPYRGDIFTYTQPFYYQFVFGGIVSLVFILSAVGAPYLFPTYFIHPNFSKLRVTVWLFTSIFSIHLLSFFYDNWLIQRENSVEWFISYEWHYAIPTFLFTGIPFFIIGYYFFDNQNKNDVFIENPLESPLILPTEIEGNSEKRTPQYKTENALKLIDFTEKNTLDITPEQLVYITSADNYIEIFYTNEEQVLQRFLMRQTMKEIENQLVAYPQFCRCHKMYIVNKDRITAVKGNSKGYQLILKNGNKPVPVSRQKNDKLMKDLIHLLDV